MEDNLGQVFLSFYLFFDSVRDVWDHVGQDELRKVNNVLYDDYKSHFGSDHMPVVDVELILPGVARRMPKISIPKKQIVSFSTQKRRSTQLLLT